MINSIIGIKSNTEVEEKSNLHPKMIILSNEKKSISLNKFEYE
jgi:hypothetical protein|tara:strand:+ start:116 stop:244 length:129 start_codon:yes stop_codon:yes gene_type:complete